jgi:TPR repeat protein
MGQHRAGGVFFVKEDQAKAMYWFRLAASGGDADAQLLLARTLRQGIGTAPDPEEAIYWAQTAADRGRPDAMVLSGDMLRQSNPEAAKVWYHKALAANRELARHGNPQACLSYGLMHVSGKGVDKDPIEALAWMLVARSFGLGSVQDVVVQLTESRMTQAQRTAALERALAIRRELAQPTTSSSS